MTKQSYALTYTDSDGFKHEHPIEAWCTNHAVDQAYNFVQTRNGILRPQLADAHGKIILSSDPWW